jgi:hypothetical protein
MGTFSSLVGIENKRFCPCESARNINSAWLAAVHVTDLDIISEERLGAPLPLCSLVRPRP